MSIQFERQVFFVERYVSNYALAIDNHGDVRRSGNQLGGRFRTEIAQRILRRFEIP